jgi:hypothetical protein
MNVRHIAANSLRLAAVSYRRQTAMTPALACWWRSSGVGIVAP